MGTGQKKGIVSLGILVAICLCCIALASPVAAIYPADKWLTNNVTVKANTSFYANINNVNWTNQYFFGVTGNGHYNTSAPAWNWTQNTTYNDRYYMEQLKVNFTSGLYKGQEMWFPSSVRDSNWEWVFIDQFGINATIYKKALGGYVNPASGTYYAWYGNRTAANTYYNGHSDWMIPTYQNATYVVNLTEIWA